MNYKWTLLGGLIGAPLGLYVHWIVFRELTNMQQLTISAVAGALIFAYLIGKKL